MLHHPASYESRLLEGRIRDSAKDLLAEIEEKLPIEVYIKALERGQGLEIEEIIASLIEPKPIPN